MDSLADIKSKIKALFNSQRFAVLATDEQGQPYVSLMAFAATDNIEQLVIVTERETRKYNNMKSNPRVAILIDNRTNEELDTEEAVVVAAMGEAEEVDGEERSDLLELYVARHPYLEGFARSLSCAIVRVRVKSYKVVERFQEVREWHIKK